MKVYKDIEQGGEQWLALRKGRPTASRFDAILTARGELSKQSAGYIRELIGECFCPTFTAFYGTPLTDRGKETEAEARDAFVSATGLTIENVGFVLSGDGVCGCSPDSLIVDGNGEYVAGLEIKCPAPKTHVGYVLDGVLPDEYIQQVHGSMVVTGLNEWHFWSYFPGMKPLHVVARRNEYTEKISNAIRSFITTYKTTMMDAVPKLKLSS